MKEYREIIRDLRVDRDLKQVTVAKALGIGQQHYSRYENGEHEIPIRILVALADFYDVSADYLLGRPTGVQGYDVLASKINAGTTVGEVVSDILNLDSANRDAVVDYVFMQKLKEEHYRHKEQCGQTEQNDSEGQ